MVLIVAFGNFKAGMFSNLTLTLSLTKPESVIVGTVERLAKMVSVTFLLSLLRLNYACFTVGKELAIKVVSVCSSWRNRKSEGPTQQMLAPIHSASHETI